MKDEDLLRILKDSLSAYSPVKVDKNRIKISLQAETLHDVAEKIFSIGFNYLHTICATDYPDKQEFELNYIVGSMDDDKRNNIIMLVTRIPKSNPSLRTVSDVWKAAKLEEREEFEMLGVNFLGNDELQKLYLPEDWNEIPPLLKEYKLKRWVDEERNRHGLVIEKVEHEH
ncbi:MAG: NADH-quinone oxidoreductase subunit C [Nitrososphaerota archaeon]